eukprot:jgi/Tetstr1/456129/TSEL_042898.t1
MSQLLARMRDIAHDAATAAVRAVLRAHDLPRVSLKHETAQPELVPLPPAAPVQPEPVPPPPAAPAQPAELVPPPPAAPAQPEPVLAAATSVSARRYPARRHPRSQSPCLRRLPPRRSRSPYLPQSPQRPSLSCTLPSL